jgi:hypothetical protein
MRPYLSFILKDQLNRRYLFIAIAAIIIQFTVFKWLYPFGDYFTDSYSYIHAAAHHHKVSFRPIGYSKFLYAVHAVTSSETALICLQYLLVQLGALHLFFSAGYFYRPGKTARLLLFAVLICNPVLLYLSDFISSDSLFAALSLFWLLQLLWMLHRPRFYQLPLLAGLLYLLLQTRLTALYYPLTGILALLLLRQKYWYKITGVLLLLSVTVFCIVSVQKATQAATGTRVFSAFSGWQWANNALHIYCHTNPGREDMPAACAGLDSFVRRYFDTACPRRITASVSTDYMWDDDKPLKRYLAYYQAQKNLPGYFAAWHAVAPIYSSYGFYLIKKNPIAYTRYYLLPGTKNYLLPSLEVMAVYNQGVDTIDKEAAHWFKYPGTKVHSVSGQLRQVLLAPVSTGFLLANGLFVTGLLWFLVAKGRRGAPAGFSGSLLLAAFFAAVNAAFSIAATPSSIRYEIFPLLLLACYSLLLFDGLLRRRRQPAADR